MGPQTGHSHTKTDESKTSEQDEAVSIPTNVKIPSIWIARGFYFVIVLLLSYLTHMINNLQKTADDNIIGLRNLALTVHDLPTREYVQKVTESLNSRLQVLELWETKMQGNTLTTQDKFEITKQITELRIFLSEAINEVDKKVNDLPNNMPPEWFVNQTAEKFKLMEERIKSIEFILYKNNQRSESEDESLKNNIKITKT